MATTNKNNYPYADEVVESNRIELLSGLYDEQTFEWLLPYLSAGQNILELGSGNGQVSQKVAETIGESGVYLGIDFTQERICNSQKNNLFSNVFFKCRDINNSLIDLSSDKFDVIFFRWFLWTLPAARRESLLTELLQMLKPGGVIIAEEAEMMASYYKPESEAFKRYASLVQKRCEMHDHPMDLGLRMPELLSAAAQSTNLSLTIEKHESFQPVVHSKKNKELPVLEIISSREALLEAGGSELELRDIRSKLEQLAEDDSVCFHATKSIISLFVDFFLLQKVTIKKNLLIYSSLKDIFSSCIYLYAE